MMGDFYQDYGYHYTIEMVSDHPIFNAFCPGFSFFYPGAKPCFRSRVFVDFTDCSNALDDVMSKELGRMIELHGVGMRVFYEHRSQYDECDDGHEDLASPWRVGEMLRLYVVEESMEPEDFSGNEWFLMACIYEDNPTGYIFPQHTSVQ